MTPNTFRAAGGLVLALAMTLSPAAMAAPGAKAVGAKAPSAKAEAKKANKKAAQLMKQGKWEEALAKLRASYEAKPDPGVRYDTGMCLYHLERWVEASDDLAAYLEDAGDDVTDERGQEVEATLEEIESHIGDVAVECDVDGASIAVDGVPSDDWEMRLDEGEHEIVVEAEGHSAVTSKIDVKGGKAIRLKVDMITPDDEDGKGGGKGKKGKLAKSKAGHEGGHGKRARLPLYWFAGGAALTCALALAAIVTGSVALSRQETYDGMDSTDAWRSYRASTIGLGVATDVLWGIAAGAAVATVVLAVFSDFGTKAEKKAWSVSPALGMYGMSLQVEF